ncbi:hypothetical protein [Agarilytica rhodophyticola]|uniref:hypothetical protein n=1 Tax=Agarilytica rhodophyticola TaxID=1737490 RepID=UPI000B349DFA|nr:hypothetical protein [Agarilytica rhodophyticola]
MKVNALITTVVFAFTTTNFVQAGEIKAPSILQDISGVDVIALSDEEKANLRGETFFGTSTTDSAWKKARDFCRMVSGNGTRCDYAGTYKIAGVIVRGPFMTYKRAR